MAKTNRLMKIEFVKAVGQDMGYIADRCRMYVHETDRDVIVFDGIHGQEVELQLMDVKDVVNFELLLVSKIASRLAVIVNISSRDL